MSHIDFVKGYSDGGDADAPEPSANRSARYRHGFQVRRQEAAGKHWPADEARRRAAVAEAEDERA